MMMKNWHKWNGESTEKSDQDLFDEMSLEVYSKDWVMRIEKSGFMILTEEDAGYAEPTYKLSHTRTCLTFLQIRFVPVLARNHRPSAAG